MGAYFFIPAVMKELRRSKELREAPPTAACAAYFAKGRSK